jgi:hypothetical protein
MAVIPNLFEDKITAPGEIITEPKTKSLVIPDLFAKENSDLATKISEAIKGTVKEAGAQGKDVLNALAPLRLATPQPPQSKLLTETIPKAASAVVEGATKPLADLEVPVFTPRNLKPLLSGDFKNLETTPVSPSALDLALIAGIPAYSAGKGVLSRIGWNKIMNDAIQSEKIKGAIMDNIGPLENFMEQGGIKLPADLPLEDKVGIIISQAQKSPTLGDILVKLSKGNIKPLAPVERGPVTDIRAEPGFASPEPPKPKIALKTPIPGDLAQAEPTIPPKTTIVPTAPVALF